MISVLMCDAAILILETNNSSSTVNNPQLQYPPLKLYLSGSVYIKQYVDLRLRNEEDGGSIMITVVPNNQPHCELITGLLTNYYSHIFHRAGTLALISTQ